MMKIFMAIVKRILLLFFWILEWAGKVTMALAWYLLKKHDQVRVQWQDKDPILPQ